MYLIDGNFMKSENMGRHKQCNASHSIQSTMIDST